MATKTTKNPSEQAIRDNGPDGMGLSDSEVAKARKEGAAEDVKETAKEVHHALTDANYLSNPDPEQFKYHGHDEIQPWAHNLVLGVDAFKERLDDKGDQSIPDNKVYGLLALERNGKNRTEYVKAMMKRLDLKADQLPGGGPDYTRDQTAISKL